MATVAARRADTASGARLERIGFGALLAFVAALQFSIAIADIFLSVALLMWLLRLVARRAPFEAPDFFVPLVAYAAITLVSAALARSITVSGETTSPTGKPSVITTTARFTD